MESAIMTMDVFLRLCWTAFIIVSESMLWFVCNMHNIGSAYNVI